QAPRALLLADRLPPARPGRGPHADGDRELSGGSACAGPRVHRQEARSHDAGAGEHLRRSAGGLHRVPELGEVVEPAAQRAARAGQDHDEPRCEEGRVTVGIVDYGLGNLGSVRNMLKRVGAQSVSVRTADEIATVDKVLLPGVGAFDTGVSRLAEAGLIDALRDFAGTGRPLLGICLGMQLLLDGSDEGVKGGLGLIPGRSVRFDEKLGIRVPHMGWNLANPIREDPLVAELPEESRFYFVHSYHVVP